MTGTALVVTADDYGLTDGTCRAIIDAHRHGVVTATSVLAVAPGIEHRLAWLDDAPRLSVGVHLALVGEDRPLLGRREISTLVDDDGAFRPSWRQLVPLLAAGRVDPADIRRELDAQISVVERHGPPTHLDTHQHLHLWPTVASVVIALAVDHQIAAIRVPRSASRGPKGRGIGRLADRLASAAGDAGLVHAERFCGLDEAGGWTSARLIGALQDLALADGSVECNVHPGPAEDPDRHRFAWGYGWSSELDAVCDPQVRRAVDRLGFELVGR